MKRDKGYTLIELILTLAVFSIIMLAIIAMMRTTLASYRNGLFETSMQEEAQILLNQVGDYLVDANSIIDSGSSVHVPSISDGAIYGVDKAGNPLNKLTHEYKISDVNGEKVLRFEKCQSADSSDDKFYSGSLYYDGQLLSDEVKDFDITGIEKTSSNFDNTAHIFLSVEYQDRFYKLDKDVFFRNNLVESASLYDLTGKETTKKKDDGGENEKDVKILRYGNLDITKKYGIVKLTGADSNASTNYVYRVNGVVHKLDSTDIVNSDISSHKAEDGVGIILECNDNLTKNFSLQAPTSGDCVVTGVNSSGTVITLNLSTDAVSFNQGGADIFVDHYAVQTNNGYHQYVTAKGIHVNNAIAAGSVFSYTLTLTKDSLTKSYNGSNVTYHDDKLTWKGTGNISHNSDGKFGTGGVTVGTTQQPVNPGPYVYTEIQVGLLADKNSEGLMITNKNDRLDNNKANDLHNSDGNQTITFSVKAIPKTSLGVGTEQTIPDFTYKYYSAGSGLDGY